VSAADGSITEFCDPSAGTRFGQSIGVSGINPAGEINRVYIDANNVSLLVASTQRVRSRGSMQFRTRVSRLHPDSPGGSFVTFDVPGARFKDFWKD
jgi:hypothetical protein